MASRSTSVPVGLLGLPSTMQSASTRRASSARKMRSGSKSSLSSSGLYDTAAPAACAARSYSLKAGTGSRTRFGRVTKA